MDEGRILHVRAIGRKISKQELMKYFQSRKQSGGGDISSVDSREGDAVITFEESDGELEFPFVSFSQPMNSTTAVISNKYSV